jgi:hypothetical protein
VTLGTALAETLAALATSSHYERGCLRLFVDMEMHTLGVC